MKILLAHSNRDFLQSYSRLLRLYGHTVTTAFDGTQVIGHIAAHEQDVVILEQELPRASFRTLLQYMNEEKTPVVVITQKRVTSGELKDKVLANAYIDLPFLPEELLTAVTAVSGKGVLTERVSFEDVEIDEKSGMLCGNVRVTLTEMEIFRKLVYHQELETKYAGPYIQALNYKMEGSGKKTRIRYILHEGYRLVNHHE